MSLPPTLTRADLSRIRLEIGLTSEQMAERVGVGAQHYRNIENGDAVLTALVENAVRWVEHVRGDLPSDICRACEGRGTVRRPQVGKAIPRRMRCTACDATGKAGGPADG